jgi:hypothetical protein
MINLYEVVLDQPTQEKTSSVSSSQTLTCFDMWLDGMKAVKAACDPISDAVACLAGTLCCVATVVAQSKENNRPATRGDVLYANQRRRNDAQELGGAFALGACIGDVLVDSTAITLGSVTGCVRASVFSFFGNNNRDNTVYGFSRETIEQVDLFSSCRSVTSA